MLQTFIARSLLIAAALGGASQAAAVSRPGDGVDVGELLRNLDVSALHRATSPPAGADEPASGPQLLGLEASLPAPWARASVEYSLLAPESASAFQSQRDNSLFRVGLDSRWRSADFGVRYFSVGEAFASESLGGRRLAEVGLGSRGEGAEAWASWSLQGFTLKPRIKQVITPQAGGEQAENQLMLEAERRLWRGLRLGYAYESLASELEAGGDQSSRRSDLGRHRLRLASRDWRLIWTRLEKETRAAGEGDGLAQSSDEVTASFEIWDRLTVSPTLAREEIYPNANAETVRELRRINLSYGTNWRWVPRVDLRLGLQDVGGQDAGGADVDRETLDAAVSFKTFLGLGLYPPEHTSLGVSLGYQQAHAATGVVPEDGVSVKLMFEHRPGG